MIILLIRRIVMGEKTISLSVIDRVLRLCLAAPLKYSHRRLFSQDTLRQWRVAYCYLRSLR